MRDGNPPQLIGLMGSKQAGKDTVATIIKQLHPFFMRHAFADVMKDMAYAIDPYVVVVPALHSEPVQEWLLQHQTLDAYFAQGSLPIIRLSIFVDRWGWEEAKKAADVRRFLQRLGTEGGRECLGEDVWVDAAFRDVTPVLEDPDSTTHFVFSDTRFPNEIAKIKNSGGEIWRIDRPGIDESDQHASEQAWRSYRPDLVIMNDGPIERLRSSVKYALLSGGSPG